MSGGVFARKDRQEVAGWFRQNRAAKVAVLVSFLLLGGLIALVLNAGSGVFFRLLSGYEEFGRLTVLYSLKAGVLLYVTIGAVLGMLSLASAVVGSQTAKLAGLSGTGVATYFRYQVIKTAFTQVLLQLVLVVPVAAAYLAAFSPPFGWVRLSLVLSVLILLPLALSVVLLPMWLWYKASRVRFLNILALLLVILISGTLLKYMFPKQLFYLSMTPDAAAFDRAYQELPLNQFYLPTHGVAHVLVLGELVPVLGTIAFGLVVLAAGLYLSEKSITFLWPKLAKVSHDFGLRKSNTTWPRHQLALMVKREILGIVRVKQEYWYLVVMGALTVLFMWLVRMILLAPVTRESYLPLVGMMIAAASGYLTIVIANRFVFPLFSKETPTNWLYQTKALGEMVMIDAKIIFALLISLPWLLLPVYLGSQFAHDLEVRWPIILFLTSLQLSIVGIHLFLGRLLPNREQAGSGEQASTSVGGFLSLGLSIGLIFLTASSVAGLISGAEVVSFLPVWLGASVVLLLALLALKHTQFSIRLQ